MRAVRRSLSRLLSLAILVAAAGPGWAEQIVLTSKRPYWEAGARDAALSRACALARFKPARADALVARFIGKDGAEPLAVAKGSGVNLYDPGHLAKPAEDYFFRNQSTTSCEVYVGGRGKRPAATR